MKEHLVIIFLNNIIDIQNIAIKYLYCILSNFCSTYENPYCYVCNLFEVNKCQIEVLFKLELHILQEVKLYVSKIQNRQAVFTDFIHLFGLNINLLNRQVIFNIYESLKKYTSFIQIYTGTVANDLRIDLGFLQKNTDYMIENLQGRIRKILIFICSIDCPDITMKINLSFHFWWNQKRI